MQRFIHSVFLAFALLLPALARAHSEHEGTSFVGGYLHPLLGPDHLLAMLSVGIISASLIHMAGVGVGYMPFLRWRNRLPMDLAGAAIAVVGMYFLVQPGL